eukprot:TRINITY_DN3258_c0_g1_i8.p1 TRINITY_DN3258_c0_g1~~TRINITY_DN3258_c0_g1_i8.p1  ORF type:complete len:312 (+),score=46.35 TRINITY_DN3258_c0_g1_i8:95-1030(+)
MLDEDSMIPCFGFGDVTTHDQHVFSFYEAEEQQRGLEKLLKRYRQITPHVKLSGPTSFGPMIRQAIRIVRESGCQYHVLLIIADGQVTRDPDTPLEKYSYQERDTMRALEEASDYPLSIVIVGVGDGPWEHMHRIDDEVGLRRFDNLQFVNFTEIMSSNNGHDRDQVFALSALSEIPQQFRCIMRQNLLGNSEVSRNIPMPKAALPPPEQVLEADSKRDDPVEQENHHVQDTVLDEQLQEQLHSLLHEKAELQQKVQMLGNENNSLKELLYIAQDQQQTSNVRRDDSFYSRQDSLYAISERDQTESQEVEA